MEKQREPVKVAKEEIQAYRMSLRSKGERDRPTNARDNQGKNSQPKVKNAGQATSITTLKEERSLNEERERKRVKYDPTPQYNGYSDPRLNVMYQLHLAEAERNARLARMGVLRNYYPSVTNEASQKQPTNKKEEIAPKKFQTDGQCGQSSGLCQTAEDGGNGAEGQLPVSATLDEPVVENVESEGGAASEMIGESVALNNLNHQPLANMGRRYTFQELFPAPSRNRIVLLNIPSEDEEIQTVERNEERDLE